MVRLCTSLNFKRMKNIWEAVHNRRSSSPRFCCQLFRGFFRNFLLLFWACVSWFQKQRWISPATFIFWGLLFDASMVRSIARNNRFVVEACCAPNLCNSLLFQLEAKVAGGQPASLDSLAMHLCLHGELANEAQTGFKSLYVHPVLL